MIELHPGDIFCTKNPMALGRAIMGIERLWAKDNKAEYSHSGIITDCQGTTLEALWTIKGNDINAYSGENVIIGRWEGMSPTALQNGYDAIALEVNEIYPLWRLPLFIFPFMAKYVSNGNWTVCSELVCKFLLGCGYTQIGEWQGQNPDDVADMIRKWKDMRIIFEGKWNPSLIK